MKKFKSIVVAALSLCMVMGSSLTAFATEMPIQNTETSVSVMSTAISTSMRTFPSGRFAVNGNGVRLRRTPSTSGEIKGLLYVDNGDWVDLNGNVVSTGNYHWLEVTNSSIGMNGWIELNYVNWN